MKHQKRPFTTRKLGSHDWQPCSGTLLANRFAHAIAFRAWCGCEFYSRWFYWINMNQLQAKKVWIKPNKRLELNKQTNLSGGNGCFETLAVILGEDIKMIGSTLFVVNSCWLPGLLFVERLGTVSCLEWVRLLQKWLNKKSGRNWKSETKTNHSSPKSKPLDPISAFSLGHRACDILLHWHTLSKASYLLVRIVPWYFLTSFIMSMWFHSMQ